jgi:hypothetical protein
MRPWLSVSTMPLRAKCLTVASGWKKASRTGLRYSCMMELLIPDEMSPISFRSSCLDSVCPAAGDNKEREMMTRVIISLLKGFTAMSLQLY